MTKRNQVYKCEICGNIAAMVHEGAGAMVCCNQKMALITENTTDAAQEKHVPVIEKVSNGYKAKVGSVAHPMDATHLIEWIELIADGKSYREFLKPGDPPEALFEISAGNVKARDYCNLHGLWKA